MHSIGKYFNTRGSQDLRTQTLGFIGNWDRFGNTTPRVTMPADNAWKWATVKGCFDPLVFEAFYANLDEKEKYWPMEDDPYTHVDKVLPRLFYFLYEIGAYAAEKPQTCFELYKYIVRLAAHYGGGITNTHIA